MTLRDVSIKGYLWSGIIFIIGSGISYIAYMLTDELTGISVFHGMAFAVFLSLLKFMSLHIIKRIPWYLLTLPALGGFFMRIFILIIGFSVVYILGFFDMDLFAAGFLAGLFITKIAEIILLMKADAE